VLTRAREITRAFVNADFDASRVRKWVNVDFRDADRIRR